MRPYYQDDLVMIFHGDCRDLDLPPAPGVGIVSDPPYGMNWNTDMTRFTRGAARPRVVGDDKPFDPTPWLDFDEVILWGANHYAARLPVGTTLVWVKRYDDGFGSFLSDAEVAWQKGGHGVYCFREAGYAGNEERFHPTQKPLSVMRWCVARTESATIYDPFAGSGSTLVAAKSLGRRAIGIEIEERWCEVAASRCSQEVLGLSA
jgi:site-specific DNA-methyltransferase (adenine-specific)